MKKTKRNRLMVLLAVVSIMVVFIIGCTNKASPDVEEVLTPTVVPTKAETPTPIPTKPVENEPTKEVTQAVTPSITPTEEVAPTETVTPTPEEVTPTPTPTEEVKVTNTPTPTVKPIEEAKKPTATPTPTKKATVTPTKKVTPKPTATPTKKPTPTPTKVVTPTTKPKPTNTPKPTATPAPVAVLCKEMLTYTNEARAMEGLKPYTWGEDLEALALKRAKEAVAEYANGTPHAGAQGSENLAKAYHYSVTAVFDAWMNSSGHKSVIMSKATETFVVEEGVEYYRDGIVYKAGETVPGKEVSMACAYVRIGESLLGSTYYWVYVIKH